MGQKLILFDCYGTLLSIRQNTAYASLFGYLGLSVREQAHRIKTSQTSWVDYARSLGRKVDAARAHALFETALAADMELIRPYADSLDTLETLHEQGVPMALLSNLGPGYDRSIRQWLPTWLPCFLSFEMGCRKPHPEAFQHVCARMGADPQGVVLVDDKQVNLDAARRLGMEGLLVQRQAGSPPLMAQLAPFLV